MGRISSLLCMDLCPLKNTRREGRITRTYTYGEIARSKWNVLCKVQQLQFHCVKDYSSLFCSESRAINPPGLTYECGENTFPFSWHPKQSSRTKFELWKGKQRRHMKSLASRVLVFGGLLTQLVRSASLPLLLLVSSRFACGWKGMPKFDNVN